jgi:hypothetical protein
MLIDIIVGGSQRQGEFEYPVGIRTPSNENDAMKMAQTIQIGNQIHTTGGVRFQMFVFDRHFVIAQRLFPFFLYIHPKFENPSIHPFNMLGETTFTPIKILIYSWTDLYSLTSDGKGEPGLRAATDADGLFGVVAVPVKRRFICIAPFFFV